MNINSLPENTPVITTKYVVEKTSPIVYLSYDKEGDFQIFSEEGADMANAKVISLKDIFNIDPSISQISDINKGEKFYRPNIESAWQKI